MSGEGKGFGGMAWNSPGNAATLNKDRSRWYGLRVGDIVTLKGPGGYVREGLKVKYLHPTDNNGCTVRDPKARREFKAVCEWCEVTRRVEDART